MRIKAVIITNNNYVVEKENHNAKITIEFVDGSLLDVMYKARDYIHKGHKLLTHPLMGSIKPNETPYKSIAISQFAELEVDYDSLMYIENSIETSLKLINNRPMRQWASAVLEDFRVIDYDLIRNAFDS